MGEFLSFGGTWAFRARLVLVVAVTLSSVAATSMAVAQPAAECPEDQLEYQERCYTVEDVTEGRVPAGAPTPTMAEAGNSEAVEIEQEETLADDDGPGFYLFGGIFWMVPSPVPAGDFRLGASLFDDHLQLGGGYTSVIFINYLFAEIRGLLWIEDVALYLDVRSGPTLFFFDFEELLFVPTVGAGVEVRLHDVMTLDLGVDLALIPTHDSLRPFPAFRVAAGRVF